MSDISIYSNGSTLEGVTLTLDFTIELSEAASASTTYYWNTSDGTASQSLDYNGVSANSLTFAVGERVKTISITLINDSLVEADESLFVDLFGSYPYPGTAVLATARGLITDTLKSATTASLADPAYVNVESLALTGTADINGTGNSNNNSLAGNTGKNILDGGAGNDSLSGGAGNDTLMGGLGNDTLDGGTGTDSLLGGAGDDLYIVDSALDIISSNATTGELTGGGNDTIQASFNDTLQSGSFIENLTLAGSALRGYGNEYNNLITGNASANILDGGGNSTLPGGDDTLMGLAGNDSITGGDGNDILDGGTGVNTLVGGTGNDIYRLTNNTDVITELAGGGVDRVETASTYSINANANLEDITLTGDSAVNATGNTGNNILIGNSNSNLLSGGAGNDIMDGKGGLDTLKGGFGDDTYILKDNPWTSLDLALEAANGGTDTVKVNADYTLGQNFEHLELLGSGDFYGFGNAQANVIFGNSGNNLLDGKGGGAGDILQGGAGDDTYVLGEAGTILKENSGEGNDTVIVNYATSTAYTLLDTGDSQYIENITLGSTATAATGNSLSNLIIGNVGADALVGNAGSDTLVGGAGQDNLNGGSGSDFYEINLEDLDTIVETASSEIDTISASYSGSAPVPNYAMAAYVEKFYLQTAVNINLQGNASDNYIETNAGKDSIVGGDGNDTVYSGTGQDTILGGTGNDQIYAGGTALLNVSNCILDGGDGADTLHGGRGNDSLLGGIGNDSIYGDNASDSHVGGADTLDGGEGDDLLDGGTGIDSLNGGNGNDVYVTNTNLDVIAAESLTGGIDRIESSVSYRLMANFENLTLTGSRDINGQGNELNNVLIGNYSNNNIDGLAGDDSINGDSGNDTLLGQAGNDTLIGGSGTDVLLGQAGNDSLDGGYDADTMQGGLSNDIYQVDNTLDLVLENLSQGVDLVNTNITYTLTDNVENLVLATNYGTIGGTGNALANTITGNSDANVIDGAAGNDTLIGGDGNDKYYLDSVSDSVVEAATTSSGVDLVFASVSGYTLAANVENLNLIGTATTGTGNTLNNRIIGNELNNTLNGGDGNDYLDGGIGNDSMVGGLGDDVYLADATGDVVSETSASGGIDRLISLADQTLSANVENLALIGANPLRGTGNTLNNFISGNESGNALDGSSGDDTLVGNGGNDSIIGGIGNDSLLGNAGDDSLSGGIGNDTLTGGLGADRFDYISSVYFSASAFGNDLLVDFTQAESDKIRLGKTTFGLSSAVGANLTTAEFKSVANEASVAGSTALIVQSQATGNLYFNPNGSAAGGDILLATTNFVGGNQLFATDFLVG